MFVTCHPYCNLNDVTRGVSIVLWVPAAVIVIGIIVQSMQSTPPGGMGPEDNPPAIAITVEDSQAEQPAGPASQQPKAWRIFEHGHSSHR